MADAELAADRGPVERLVHPALQLSRRGFDIVGGAGTLDRLARQFASRHAVHLPGFLAPDVRALVERWLATAEWDVQIHDQLDPPSVHLTVRDPALLSFFTLAMNDRRLVEAVRHIAAIERVGAWEGNFYRMDADCGHHDTWHDDADGNRLVAITINVSPSPFQGGELSMRVKQGRRPLWTFANVGPGDALLFRLDRRLEHWIHDVRGPAPKMAVAGWFQREPDFWRDLRAAPRVS
ncbi:MAG: 2OG-Fe(II) oxygenase [Acidobacteriota bacterium]